MRRPLALLAALALAAALVATAGRAQDRVGLIADRVYLASRTVLVAEGNVEVLYRDIRLRAARIVYDRGAERLSIAGPIVLTQGDRAVVLADQAELSADLTEGLMTGARLLLDRRLQLAATDLLRLGGRYTRLRRVAATSCEVCPASPVPLWEIRAERAVHDEAARQLYFSGAQFRFAGLPVFYLPALRMPDPTLRRATGFLLPELRSTSTLGFGVAIPYFIVLGPSRDLTLTPYLATSRTATLGLRYREALRGGGFTVEGAVSRDDLVPGATRGFLFGTGSLALARGFGLAFRLEAVSDPTYLADYGRGRRDRLTSGLTLARVRREEVVQARLLGFRSLRPGEGNGTLPAALAEGLYERRFAAPGLGGTAVLRLQALGLLRPSDDDGAGRDGGRLSLRLGWQRTAVVGPGVLARAEAELAADAWAIGQDPAFPAAELVARPTVAAELRWPLVRTGSGGGRTLLEPVLHVAWSPRGGPELPNEDSRIVELDEGNLFALSRFPGQDAAERGLRATLGLQARHVAPAGWSAGFAVARILRPEDDGAFSPPSGLAGRSSDWFLAGDLAGPGSTRLAGRALLGDDLEPSRGELRLAWQAGRADLQTAVVWLSADPAENRPTATAEWTVDAALRLDANWTGRIGARYDFEAERATEAGFGLVYRNECIAVDLSVSRRFTAADSIRPSTDFSLTVGLLGFGGAEAAGPPGRRCRP